MFPDWSALIQHQKNVQKLTTEQLGDVAGVSRATAFRWAAGSAPPWFNTARALFFGSLASVVDRWAQHTGGAGTLDVRFALDGGGVAIEHGGVVVGVGSTLAEAIEDAARFLETYE